MTKIKAISTILLCCLFICVNAQIPGYRGKHCLMSFGFSPSVIIPSSTSPNSSSKFEFKIRPRLSGCLDFVVSRSATLGFKYSYLNSVASNPVFYEEHTNQGDFIYAGSNYFDITAKCHSFNMRVIKYYSGNLPAPIGKFIGFSFGAGISQATFPKHAFIDNYGAPNTQTSKNRILPDFTVMYGIRKAMSRSLMCSISIDVNLAAAVFYFSDLNGYEPGINFAREEGTSDVGKVQYRANKSAVAWAYYNPNLINFSLELSFLPF